MAAPHVAGLVALLISARPSLAGQVEEIETLIEHSALPRTTSQNCGSVPGTSIPNNTYGWGRIDALAAYQALRLILKKSVSTASILPGSILTYTLAITNTQSSLPLTNLVLTDILPTRTNFIGATPPFNLNGNTLRWDFSQLTAGTGQTVHFSVQVPITSTGQVINHDYGVHSAEVSRSVIGPPVATTILAPGVAISPPFIVEVLPGTTITLTHTITNTGNATSTYTLAVAANPNWINGSSPSKSHPGTGSIRADRAAGACPTCHSQRYFRHDFLDCRNGGQPCCS